MENKQLVWKILRIGRGHRKIIDREVASLGIHPSQHHLLMHLARVGEATQCGIAKDMEISAATVAVSLKKLEKGNYIEKKVNPEDNRMHYITLTPKGEEVVRKSKHLFDGADAGLLEGLTEEEKEKFQDILERVIQNVKRMEEK